MTREEAIDRLTELLYAVDDNTEKPILYRKEKEAITTAIKALKQTTVKWIPCSERLPEDSEPVNITWVNHNPVSYYADIKDKPFTATGHYCNGKWWWFSATCQDYLDEYGRSDNDDMSNDIEVTAWMPLPKPWEGKQCGR